MDIFFFASTTEGGGCNDTIVHYELLMNQQKKPSLLNHLFFFIFGYQNHIYIVIKLNTYMALSFQSTSGIVIVVTLSKSIIT